ncbi:hypothetical protein GAMM_30094 [Gammaproteobacteria bacterium]
MPFSNLILGEYNCMSSIIALSKKEISAVDGGDADGGDGFGNKLYGLVSGLIYNNLYTIVLYSLATYGLVRLLEIEKNNVNNKTQLPL